jgi:outer membrane murein-binding lipoprotein Lpp
VTDGAIHEVSRAVGSLQSDIKSMASSIETLNRTWSVRERDASSQRRAVHDKLDETRNDVTKLTACVERLASEVADLKPAVAEFKAARQRQVGAQRMGKMVWVAFLGIAGAIGGAVVHFFGR